MIWCFFKCFKNIHDLDIFDIMYSFTLVTLPLRNIDYYITIDIPFSHTETVKNSVFTRVCPAQNKLHLSFRESNTLPVICKKLFNYFSDKFSANFLLQEIGY